MALKRVDGTSCLGYLVHWYQATVCSNRHHFISFGCTTITSDYSWWLNIDHLIRPYSLSPATLHYYCSCVLRIKYWMLYSTSCLRIDSPSIPKRLVECTMQYFHAQHAQTIMLPCHQWQKLPRVWSPLHVFAIKYYVCVCVCVCVCVRLCVYIASFYLVNVYELTIQVVCHVYWY